MVGGIETLAQKQHDGVVPGVLGFGLGYQLTQRLGNPHHKQIALLEELVNPEDMTFFDSADDRPVFRVHIYFADFVQNAGGSPIVGGILASPPIGQVLRQLMEMKEDLFGFLPACYLLSVQVKGLHFILLLADLQADFLLHRFFNIFSLFQPFVVQLIGHGSIGKHSHYRQADNSVVAF